MRRLLAGVGRNERIALIYATLVALIFAAGVAMHAWGEPLAIEPGSALQPPSSDHWFGTDSVGFDVFNRTVAAARLDLPLAVAGISLSLVIGVILGLLAGRRGRAGEALMRALDGFQAFPLLILAVAIVALMGNRLANVIVAIAIINVPRFMRLVRAEVLSLRETRFIEAAVAIGCSPMRVMYRHLLPNAAGTILVQASLGLAQSLIVIASLSFIGIGVTPPTPSWGAMVRSGVENITLGQWWIAFFPAAAILVVVFLINGLADRLSLVIRRGGR